jgi:uncharacterized membrane protein
MTTTSTPPPQRGLAWLRFALSIAGVLISAYLSATHQGGIALVCSDSGIVNCAKVTSSAQSYFLGVPVAYWGLMFFAGAVVMHWPALRGYRVEMLRTVMMASGVVFILWLVYAELVLIGSICLWCTAVHIVTATLFLLDMRRFLTLLGAK